ncbi:MAG: PilZ domain-containing protein [Deltaproteobacteria bacterium]|nr:PilZ domain-containing protein [Deltaproteobacteria bacterium]MBW2116592.1 PilZ domain-containing protein [Deltaproteobacteria bacterium]MBW2343030.1 PilZ domain-containing protein [Deltaproteobacteria bacterium]
MEVKRKQKRRDLITYLRVFGENAEQPIGHLVTITTDGMMLISEEPIETGKVFQLRVVLPAEIEGSKEVSLPAKSMWCREDENPAFYNTGFQLINPSPNHIKIIEHLIQKYCFKESLGQL